MGSPILPFIGIGLTVLAVLFYIIATATNAWASHRGVDSTADLGLWKSCYGSTCDTLGFILTNADAIYVSRFAMITAILVAVGALIIPLLVFFKKLQKKLVKVSAGLIIGTAVLVLCGTISFAVFKEDRLTEYGYGYSIILAWLSIPIAIAGGVLILLGGLETPVKFMENDVALA
ncbi:epithelial membrane protein 1-like isoform X1 [Ptychodera flava]|uniref:epithelial membrane protein 1-like isoform X1 n=1 Tax=Ptychodera flava TaxID=63121 RepID=UPI003969ED21